MTDNGHMHEHIRAGGYALLSACYYPPDEALMAAIKEGVETCGTVARELCRNLPAPGAGLADVYRDYVRLFVGPFKTLAPPYGSVYLEKDACLMGASTADVMNWYEADGLKNALREPPDHIAVELEYLHFLVVGAVNAATNGRHTEALEYLRRERKFLETHLGQWAPAFTVNVEKHAETAFYRCLAGVTRGFLENAASRASLAENLTST